jgi:hypothetical protein
VIDASRPILAPDHLETDGMGPGAQPPRTRAVRGFLEGDRRSRGDRHHQEGASGDEHSPAPSNRIESQRRVHAMAFGMSAIYSWHLDAFNGNDTSGVTDASHLLGDSGQAPTCWSAAFARDVTPLSP